MINFVHSLYGTCNAIGVSLTSLSENGSSYIQRSRSYRVTHLQANLGWVDFDLGCSTLCLVLPGLMGNWQNWLSRLARW